MLKVNIIGEIVLELVTFSNHCECPLIGERFIKMDLEKGAKSYGA
jgi:hypothetical protein